MSISFSSSSNSRSMPDSAGDSCPGIDMNLQVHLKNIGWTCAQPAAAPNSDDCMTSKYTPTPWTIHAGDPKSTQALQKKVGKWFTKQRVGLIIGPAIFLLLVLMPEPSSMAAVAEEVGAPDRAPQIALGTLLWVLVWWVTECVPLGIAALLPPIIFSMSRIVAWKTTLSAFTDPIIWIFMAGFVLAAAFRKWDLDRRIAIRLGLLYKGSNPMIAAFFVASLPVFILTLTGSITASTAVVFPFLIAYLSMVGVKSGSLGSCGRVLVIPPSRSMPCSSATSFGRTTSIREPSGGSRHTARA